jgi:hypothetical protein
LRHGHEAHRLFDPRCRARRHLWLQEVRKIPAGGEAGVHGHSAAYQAVVVSGTHKHWLPGDKKVKPLKPGSYVRQPGGQPHGDTCTGDSECVLFLIMEGKLDFTPTPDVKEVKDRGDYKEVAAGDAKRVVRFSAKSSQAAANPRKPYVSLETTSIQTKTSIYGHPHPPRPSKIRVFSVGCRPGSECASGVPPWGTKRVTGTDGS